MDQKQVCTAVMRRLNNLRLSESFCDITLMVGEVTFPAHKTVLAGTSKFFHNILSADESSGIFQINGINASDMMKILDFIYTGQMHITKGNVDAIDALAGQLQIDLLNQVCSAFKTSLVKSKIRHKNKPGSSRTRTYTRWGKQHSLSHPKSPDSDVSELDSVASSMDHDEETGVNGFHSSNTLADEYTFADAPVKITDQLTDREHDSKKRTSLSVVDRNLGKECNFAKTLTVLNPVISGILKGLNPEPDKEQGHVIQDTDVSANILVLSGVKATEDLQNKYDTTDSASGKTNKGLLSSNIITFSDKITDMESIDPNSGPVINIYEDLAVSSIGDSHKGPTLVADCNSECDLSSLLDIQSFFSSYPNSQQVVSSVTCPIEKSDVHESASLNNSGDTAQSMLSHSQTKMDCINSEDNEAEKKLEPVENEKSVPQESQSKFIQVFDNLNAVNVSTLAVCSEDAGFHDYCLMADNIRFLPTQVNNADSYNGCEAEGKPDRLVDNHENTRRVYMESASGLSQSEEPDSSSSDRIEKGTSEILLGAKCISDAQAPNSVWRDTHIMIIKQPPEGEANNPKRTKRAKSTDGEERKLWHCPWCSNSFSKVVQMKRHAQTVHPTDIHRCSFCKRVFVDRDKCDSHMDWCRVKKKIDGRYHCPHCKYNAVKIYHVVDHYRTKHTNKQQRRCASCDQVFSSLNTYYDHLLKAHKVSSAEIVHRKVHICDECDFRTVKRYAFKTHQLQHVKERYPCEVCEKSFKSIEILKRHKKIIHGGNMFKCRICNFKSKYAATMKTHEYRRHHLIRSEEQKVHFCHYCDYSNVNQADVKKHELNKHSDERPFLCSYCPKCFKHKHQVVIHERLHTGLRPFKCNLCSYAGRTKVALVTHTSHRHSNIKAFVCEICGFRTKVSSNLWFHKARCRKKLAPQTTREVIPSENGGNMLTVIHSVNVQSEVE